MENSFLERDVKQVVENALTSLSQEELTILKMIIKEKCEAIIKRRSLYESLLEETYNNKSNAEEVIRKNPLDQRMNNNCDIQVICRVRPFSDNEIKNKIEPAELKFSDDKRIIYVYAEGLNMQVMTSSYEFERVFDGSADQEEIYSELSPLVQSAISGQNICIFTYGSSGSGKTYTMEGDAYSPEKKGIIPRVIDEIYDKIEDYKELGWSFVVHVQYIKIYNETIQDLLIDEDKTTNTCNNHERSYGDRKKPCKIMYNEDTRMTVIENAQRCNISQKKDMENLVHKILACKSKSSTTKPSSHSVLILHLEGVNPLENMSSRSALSLIDLACPENTNKSSGFAQITEAQIINRQVFYLRNAIQQTNRANYCDTTLTSLLKYSLDGAAKVCMIVNVSPLADSVNETKRSLNFGRIVRNMKAGMA
ncbi:hypothetical protein RclHR1_09080002 [Rhizophagus clarus]|nr:hypothetical protein RclHR1_09080002 [Rhizophagus clarus]